MIDLPEMEEGQEREVRFELAQGVLLSSVKDIRPSCGCVRTRLDKRSNSIVVTFRAGSVPAHLQQQGFYNTRKHIAVIFDDEEKVTLSFYVVIAKKRKG